MKTVDELCAEHGLSREALAERAGMDVKRVLAILEGRWTPSPAERDRVAAVFGLTRDEIAWGHKTTVSHLYGHGPQFGRTP
jgi:transcriptional regulator with XRE-family HTH domain